MRASLSFSVHWGAPPRWRHRRRVRIRPAAPTPAPAVLEEPAAIRAELVRSAAAIVSCALMMCGPCSVDEPSLSGKDAAMVARVAAERYGQERRQQDVIGTNGAKLVRLERQMKPATVFLGEMTNLRSRSVSRDASHRHRSHRRDRTARAARTTADRRPHPAGGGAAGGADDRRGRRAADQLCVVLSARRLHRARPHPHLDVHGAHRGSVRVVRGVGIQADHLS